MVSERKTNMKKTTRVTALLLVLVMLMQTFSFAVQIGDFTDFPVNSWSTEAMTAAVDNGLLIGMDNNKIEPKRNLTRAEMAAIITRAFGATVEKDISVFSDVKSSDWYSSVVAKAYNMQVMQGTGDTTFAPQDSITRQEVFLALARVLHIDSTDYSVLDKFLDKADVAEWSKNAVTGMVEVDYLHGYNDGKLLPKGKITREELAQVFHNIFKTYISAPGHYTSVAPEGSVIIRAPGVILENVTINGDLVLADGIGAGDCTVYNVHVNGRIIVRGGEGTVDFVNVTSTGNVIINDVNGTVNFHNYRTEAPFADNLLELTPATFLVPQSQGGSTGGRPGGPTGGGAPTYAIDFLGLDGKTILDKPLRIKKDSSIAFEGKTVPTFTVPEEYVGHSFYSWINSEVTKPEDVLNNPKLLMSESDVANAKVTGKVNYNVVVVDNDTGLLVGGPFGDGSLGYHGAPAGDTVTKNALMYHYDTDDKYPIKWNVTFINDAGETVTEELGIDELVEKINNLEENEIIAVEVIETADKIVLTFKDNVTGTETPVYAIPGYPLETDSIPVLNNVTKDGYFYEAKGWTLTEGSDVLVNFTTHTFDAQTVIYAKYEVSAIKIIVKYFHDADKNGVYDETPVEDTNGDGVVDEYDIAPEQYDTQNYDKPTHSLLENELPVNPSYEGIDNGTLDEKFIGWAENVADAENEIVISYPYSMTEENNPYKLYSAFTSDFSNVTFTDATGVNDDVTVKIGNNTGNIIEGTIPTDFVPADEEKQYFFGWKNTETGDEIAADDFADYVSEYVKTNKEDVSFEAVFKNKTVITFYEEDKTTVYKTQYIIPDGVNKATEEAYPAIADTEKQYVDGWTTDGTTAFDFDTVIGEDNIDLYPLVKDKTVVTFYEEDKTTVYKTQYIIPDGVNKATEEAYPAIADTEKQYVDGWTTDGTTAFDFDTVIGEDNIDLYLLIKDKTAVTFYEFDTTTKFGDTVYYKPDESVAAPSGNPELLTQHVEQYYFLGWSTEKNQEDLEEDELFVFGKEAGENDIALYPVLGSRIPVDFKYTDTKNVPSITTVTKYAIPEGYLETDRIPTADGYIYKGYAYVFKYWTLDEDNCGGFEATDTNNNGVIDIEDTLIGAGAEVDFAETTIDKPNTVFYAVYLKTPVDVIAKFIYDIDKDGNIEDTPTEDTNNDGNINDEDKYPDEYDMKPAHTDELIPAPTNPGDYADHEFTYTFKYWTLDKEKSGAFVADENGDLVGAGADMDIATYTVNPEHVDENNVLKIYAVFEKTAVPYTVIFTVDDKEDFRETESEKLAMWTDNEEPTVYGGVVPLPAAGSEGIPVRNGTTFKYWYAKNADGSITKYENVTSLRVEPEVTEEKPLPETKIVLYAYMECAVNFIDEVNDAVGPRNKTVYVQYNNKLDSIPDWTRVEKGFERTPEMSEDYAKLYPEGYVHEIHHSWFEKDYEGKWAEDAENGWIWSALSDENAKFVDFDEKAVVTTDMNVYLSTRRIDATANLESDRLPNIGVEASVPYEKETRLLDALKDALFLNEGYITAAVNESGVQDKIFDKLRNQNLMADNSTEILNIYKTVLFVSVLGEENLNKFIDEQLKRYFQSDEAAQTLNEFLVKYITEGNVEEVSKVLKDLLDEMLEKNHDDTLLLIEQAAHQIAENDITALEDIIVAYVESCLDHDQNDGDSEDELKKMLDDAFHQYCDEHPDEFKAFLKNVIEDLLVGEHRNDRMRDLVIEIAIDKVKAGYFKDRIETEVSAIDNETLAEIIIEIVGEDIGFVESEITAALDDENFVISIIELLADDNTFKATIKTLAEETLDAGGDDLKNELKEMFLNDLTPEQQENLIDSYVSNLNDPAKIRELALNHIAEISNEQILSYIQGDNPLIVLSASDLLGYIKDYQNQIPNATILAKIKEENSPIKVPSDKLLALVKDGTISIPENTVLSLVKTELKNLDNATIASYIADGTIPVDDSFIEEIIISEIEAERDSLVAEAIQAAKDSGDYDTAVEGLMLTEGLSEDEAKAKVEQDIADEVDLEIDSTIAEETTPEKIADAKTNITEEQVNTYRDDIDAKIDALTYASIETYAEDYIQNKLTAQDIEDNYATLVAQLDETTFASMKASVIDALDVTTVEANKAAFLSLVTADIVGNVKTTVITNASDADILKIKESIAGVLKTDATIRETVINDYIDDAFESDDLGENLDKLLADTAGRHLVAVVISDYIKNDPDAKQTLIDEVIGTLENDIENNNSKMLEEAITAYISDSTRKAALITKAVDMLSTPDAEGKYYLDDTNSDLYMLVCDAIDKLIADDEQRTGIIDDYVASVVGAETVSFAEIIDIFCEGTDESAKAFRKNVIVEFLENLEKIEDKDGNGVGDGVEIIEEMIDRILENMSESNEIDLSIIKMTVQYISDNAENEHGQKIVTSLIEAISEMDDILSFAKDLGYDAVNENLAEIDKFKKQVSTQEQFEVNEHNVFIMGPLRELIVSLEFDNMVDKYIRPRLPEKVLNELPFDIAKTIYDRSQKNYLDQLDAAIAKAENGEVGYVNSGVTFHFNPVHEIYVPIYEYALEEYEKACGFIDDNTGRPGDAYDKYVKENPYIDDLIELLSPERLFNEVSTEHEYTKVGSGYAVRSFTEYYDIVKTAAVLLDDTFLWYLENVDYQDIENVLYKAEDRVLGYTNLLVSLANSYAKDGIPDDIEDIYNDILADALASGDFEKIVGKVENITNKDVEYYIDRVLANRYPELAYDKVLDKAGARAATILELYINSKFNRFVDGDDYDKVVEWLEFAYEDQNANITVDYVFDKIMDEDNTRNVEFRGNTAEITRRIAPTLSDN